MDNLERSRMLEQFDNSKADKYPLDKSKFNGVVGRLGILLGYV